MKLFKFLKLLPFTLFVALVSNSYAQSETEFYSNGVVFPKVSAASITSPVEGQVIYNTDSDKLAVYNGSAWISAGGTGLWETSTHGIKYDNTANVGIGTAANSGTKLFVQGDYFEDPFRVQIGREDNPNDGATKMRILAKYNSMVLGSSWNSIDSSDLNSFWSNYKKHYFRDSLCLGNPSNAGSVVLTTYGLQLYGDKQGLTVDLDAESGLASFNDLSVTEEASFGQGLISSDPIKLRETGNGPAGPEILFMDDGSTTTSIASIKVTNSTGGGNNHDLRIENKSTVGDILFLADGSQTHFKMGNENNFSYFHLSPWLPNTHDLGSMGKRWRTIYAQNALNTSDVRLKKDINTISSSILPQLMKLEATSYHYKSDNEGAKKTIGFLAQEVEKINPDWVVPPTVEGEHYLLNYNNFTVLAIKGLQEQQSIIETLQTEIKLLKEEITKIVNK